ncbi:MAG: fluoride efflux transporter CrcB [Saprospiraceae bacterium]|jgi:CrcB protein|nr:fluoride efflux transporter CrcB [Saprospiraceae bacterium]
MMINWLWVFLGGGIGSMCRFALAQKLNYTGQEYVIFPYGTILANILSCLILGILIEKQFSHQLTENYRILLITGFCGGFSTFSTFSYEIYIYMQKDQLLPGLGYTFLSMVSGIAAIIIGIKLYQIFL